MADDPDRDWTMSFRTRRWMAASTDDPAAERGVQILEAPAAATALAESWRDPGGTLAGPWRQVGPEARQETFEPSKTRNYASAERTSIQ